MGYTQHSRMVIVADSTKAVARKLDRLLWNDLATGVMRHADPGYKIAIYSARGKGLDLLAIL
jgi:urocanate hydratase